MVVSTQTTPLRPYCPSCFSLSHSSRPFRLALSSWSFLASSEPPRRRKVRAFQIISNSLPYCTVPSSYPQSREVSCSIKNTSVGLNEQNDAMKYKCNFPYKIPPRMSLMKFSNASGSMLEEMTEKHDHNSLHSFEAQARMASVASCNHGFSVTAAERTLSGDYKGWAMATDKLTESKKGMNCMNKFVRENSSSAGNRLSSDGQKLAVSMNGGKRLVLEDHVLSSIKYPDLNNSHVFTDSKRLGQQFDDSESSLEIQNGQPSSRGSHLVGSGEILEEKIAGVHGDHGLDATTKDSTTKDTTNATFTRQARVNDDHGLDTTTKDSTTKASTTKASTTKASTTKASTTKDSTTKDSTTKDSTNATFARQARVNGDHGLDTTTKDSTTKDSTNATFARQARVNGGHGLDTITKDSTNATFARQALVNGDHGLNTTTKDSTTKDSTTKDSTTKDSTTKDSTNATFARQARVTEQSKLRDRLCSIYEDVLVVNNISHAEEVAKMLTVKYRHLIHACDTEVAKIEVKEETPVDHGEIICFSIYSGPEADFGGGKSCIWVDVLDGGGKEILYKFAEFFSDPSIKKVWHNYSFDCHIIENYGFKVSGFHGDTMHMARLWDSSRRLNGGYSLEGLTGDRRVMSKAQMNHDKDLLGKVSMKTIFGQKNVKKDGSEGKMITIAPVEELQRAERIPWICYSALDARSTLKLYESLKSHLSEMPWKLDGVPVSGKTMYDFYTEYWRPFGEVLVKMESEGMLVDRPYLETIEKVAKAEQEIAATRFRNWACKYCPDAKYMNVGSDLQLRQLLFGGTVNRKDPDLALPTERVFKIPNVEKVIEEGKKVAKKNRDIILKSIGYHLKTDIYTESGWPSVSGDALKTLAGNISAEYDFTDEACYSDLEDQDGQPSQSQIAPAEIDNSAYGTAFAAFPTAEEGREACHAIAALCEICSINSLISNFILPLQGHNISGKDNRVHCSLNINTETGRLSARRPNLQNQPALEKDRYKIRQAFIAAPGNSLIVADYGQLELRILAHLANCRSMLEAFKAGGDFHSRTAMNMYPYIREAVEKRQVLLEWHPQPGEDKPPVPLLKDAFGSERRKAKMLNFSIAYGKTPVGLSKDWKVSVKEAKKTVDLWYNDRKEVLQWQYERKREAHQFNCVYTLLGRARRFPMMHEASSYQKGHIERAAINTPVQGSAADVAMCAMLQIINNKQLKELGWKLLLQVHDEVILEGPTESAEVAKAIVVDCMSKPFNGKNFLNVDLSVDAKCAKNWYSAK